MNKTILLVFCVALLSGCQTAQNNNYNDGYVTTVGYYQDHPNWNSDYRMNTSNYFGNRDFRAPGASY